MPSNRSAIQFLSFAGVQTPATWFLRKHPAAVIAACSICLYIYSLSYLYGYLWYLGAQPAWFDLSLWRMVAFSVVGILVGLAVSLFMLWTRAAVLCRSKLKYAAICYFHWFVFTLSSVVAWTTMLDSDEIRNKPSTPSLVALIVIAVFSIGLLWFMLWSRPIVIRNGIRELRFHLLSKRISRLERLSLRTEKQSQLMSAAKSSLKQITKGSRWNEERLLDRIGLPIVFGCFLPACVAFLAGRAHAHTYTQSSWMSTRLSSGMSVVLFTDGKAMIKMGLVEGERKIYFMSAAGDATVDLVLSDMDFELRTRLADHEAYMARWSEVEKSNETPEVVQTRKVLLNARLDIIKGIRKSATIDRRLVSETLRNKSDAWGNRIRVVGALGKALDIEIQSPGPDGAFETFDDVSEGKWLPKLSDVIEYSK